MRWMWLVLATALLQPALVHAQDSAEPPIPETVAPAAQEDETPAFPIAGRVELVEGDVLFINAGGARRPKLEDPIYEGESVHTGGDGEVHLRMEDGGLVAVRPGTRMSITQFRAEGQDTDRMTLGLLEGGFRAITGWIARFNRANYQVRTPNVTIGVRGTDHEPFVIPEGSPLGEPGTYDKVNQGGTYIESAQGRIDVAPGRTAFAHFRRAERPRMLAQAPRFFRGGRHEARITQRYQQIQLRLQGQREQRRQRFEARRVERQKRLEERRGAQPVQPQERRREQLQRGGAERRKQLERRRPEAGAVRPQRLEERRRERDARQPHRGEQPAEVKQRRSRTESKPPQRARELRRERER